MRLRESLEAIIEAIVGRRLDYHALYPCTVASQASDGTLDLLPDDARMRGTGTSGIKLRHGLPGFSCTVPAGARVLMGFEAGDPGRPYAAAWDVGSVTSVTFDGGTESIARTNDTAGELCADMIGAVPGGVGPVIYYRSPIGTGVWAPLIPTIPPGPPAPAQVGTPITIDAGNTKLKA